MAERQSDENAARTPLLDRILEPDPELIAISAYVWNVHEVEQTIRNVRNRSPSTRIVVGGPEVAHSPESSRQSLGPDWVCLGEGELPFLELLTRLDQNNGFTGSLPGMLGSGSYNEALRVSAPLISELDTIPSPYLAGLLKVGENGWVDLETMRGCAHRCGFCMYGKGSTKVRCFSLDRVRREVQFGLDAGCCEFYFMDPTFNLPDRRCFGVCKELNRILPHDAEVSVELRAESITALLAQHLAAARVRHAEVGLQSVSTKALTTMNRKLDRYAFALGCERLNAVGIRPTIGVIVGLPGDTEGTVREAIDFVTKEDLGDVEVYRLQVLPGSRVRFDADRLGVTYSPEPPYYVKSTPQLMERQIDVLYQEITEATKQSSKHHKTHKTHKTHRQPEKHLAKKKPVASREKKAEVLGRKQQLPLFNKLTNVPL